MILTYFNPKNDFAFKRIFGEERNKDILIEMINAVLGSQLHRKVVDVELLKTQLEAETMVAKQSIVDVLCKDQDGCQYIIEMQVAKRAGFEKRAQFYASKAYISQMKQGGLYHNLKQVIFLAFADYPIFDEKESYKSEHIILDRETGEHNLKDFSFTFINLPKFIAQTNGKIPTTLEEKFYYFLAVADQMQGDAVEKLQTGATVIKKAFNELSALNWSEAERNAYDSVEKRERDHEAILHAAREEGEEVGEKRGVEKGRKEESISIAREMLAMGLDKSVIAQATKLSLKEIEALEKK